jgi:hypothetical protein
MMFINSGTSYAKNVGQFALHPGAVRYYNPELSFYEDPLGFARNIVAGVTLLGSSFVLVIFSVRFQKRRRMQPVVLRTLNLLEEAQRISSDKTVMEKSRVELWRMKDDYVKDTINSAIAVEQADFVYEVLADAIRRISREIERLEKEQEETDEESKRKA